MPFGVRIDAFSVSFRRRRPPARAFSNSRGAPEGRGFFGVAPLPRQSWVSWALFSLDEPEGLLDGYGEDAEGKVEGDLCVSADVD